MILFKHGSGGGPIRSRVVTQSNLSLSLSPSHPVSQMTNRSVLTRELLEGMKRSDLQRVCKVRVVFTSVNSNPHAFIPCRNVASKQISRLKQ